MWETNDEKTKLARVIVNFGRDLDDSFKINISKQIVQLPQQLQVEIKKIADIARRDSQKKYRKEVPPPPAPPPPRPTTPTDGGGSGAGPAPGRRLPVPPGPVGKPAPPPEQLPRIALKMVKTDKFVWKVTQGMAGEIAVQVSDLNPSLSALVKQIGNDPRAIAYLATFLGGLDDVEIQKRLLSGKAG